MSAILSNTISSREEMTAYETLWALEQITRKGVSEFFRRWPGLPSHLFRALATERHDLGELHRRVERLCLKTPRLHG